MTLSIRESPFGGQIINIMEFSGLRLADGVYAAKTRVPDHSHQQAVFCMALNGVCQEVYAGKAREYKALTVEFLPINKCHSLSFPYLDTRAFSVDLADYWLERAREFSLKLDDAVFREADQLSRLMIRIYAEFLQPDHVSRLAIEGLTLEMLAEVSRSRIKSERTPPRWLIQALDLLRERFSERLTISELAEAVGVHPVHLAREFRKHYRCTIGEYIRRLRIETACLALASSDRSLSAIALAAGFADQSHFSRTFKRLIGMTPLEYRANVSAR